MSNNKIKSPNSTTVKKEGFFNKLYNFPNVLNRITILFIVLLVLFVVTGSLMLIARNTKVDPYVIPNEEDYFKFVNNDESLKSPILNKESGFVYDYNIASHLEIATNNTVSEKDGEETVTSRNTIKIHTRANSTTVLNYKYRISRLNEDGTMKYFNELNSNVQDYFTANTGLSSKTLDTTEYTSLIDRVYFKMQYAKSAEKIFPTQYTYYQDIFKLNKRDFDLYTDKSEIENVFNVTIEQTRKIVTSTNEVYFTITLKSRPLHEVKKTENEVTTYIPYNIDVQSWAVTKDGQIYPLVGLYNYAYSTINPSVIAECKNNTTVSIYKNLNVEYIYVKGVHTDANNVTSEILYKVPMESFE